MQIVHGERTCSSARSMHLKWQDCSLQAEQPLLRLTQYTHSPDPIVHGKNNTIIKRFEYAAPGLGPIQSLREQVNVSHRGAADEPWRLYFSNDFDLCSIHPDLCGTLPGAQVSFSDKHPPSHTSFSPHFQAIEHYFVNGLFAGCATIVYDQAAEPIRPVVNCTCAVGLYSNFPSEPCGCSRCLQGTANPHSCGWNPAGMFDVCEPCKPGYHQPAMGEDGCDRCPSRTYSPESGWGTECLSCEYAHARHVCTWLTHQLAQRGMS